MSERWRWVWLYVVLVIGFGGGLFVTLLIVDRNERAAQQDLCELVTVFDDPSAPPATTPRGKAQQDAMRAYRAKRC